jgi:hypothetical protein
MESTGRQFTERVSFRCSAEFYETLKDAARRAQLPVTGYTRLAISERMALDALGVAVLEKEGKHNDG